MCIRDSLTRELLSSHAFARYTDGKIAIDLHSTPTHDKDIPLTLITSLIADFADALERNRSETKFIIRYFLLNHVCFLDVVYVFPQKIIN